ncbi:MAG TPA: LPXTG cell wall anchor domain-containing protein [Leptolinea sp.]
MNSKMLIKLSGLMFVLGLILTLSPMKITLAGSPNQSIPTAIKTATNIIPQATNTPHPSGGDPSSTPIPPGPTAFPSNTPSSPSSTLTLTPDNSLVTTSPVPVTLTAITATVTPSGLDGINDTTTPTISAISTITLSIQSGQATSTLPAGLPAQSQNGSDSIPYIIGIIGVLLIGGIIWLLIKRKNTIKL